MHDKEILYMKSRGEVHVEIVNSLQPCIFMYLVRGIIWVDENVYLFVSVVASPLLVDFAGSALLLSEGGA